MKLYVTVTSERNSRTAKKGGDEFLEIELSAFGKNVGRLILETQVDGSDGANQYLLKFSPSSASNDWTILKEGGRHEGMTLKA